jgi:hypothetical protein
MKNSLRERYYHIMSGMYSTRKAESVPEDSSGKIQQEESSGTHFSLNLNTS